VLKSESDFTLETRSETSFQRLQLIPLILFVARKER